MRASKRQLPPSTGAQGPSVAGHKACKAAGRICVLFENWPMASPGRREMDEVIDTRHRKTVFTPLGLLVALAVASLLGAASLPASCWARNQPGPYDRDTSLGHLPA